MPDTVDQAERAAQAREAAETRLQTVARKAAEEIVFNLFEQVGIDLRTTDGKRRLRQCMDYLEALFKNQDSNRAALDFARVLMGMKPEYREVYDYVVERIKIETAQREQVRKTLTERIVGGIIYVLIAGVGGLVVAVVTKGHLP